MHEFRPASEVERDRELAVALRADDADAVRTLYDRFGRPVFAVALGLVGDTDRAADVTQHVFLQAWRNADDFEPGREFSPWLATLTRRAAAFASPAGDADGGRRAEPQPSADAVEVSWSISAAIGRLDADERAAARGQFLEGKAADQIADDLGVPVDEFVPVAARAERLLTNQLGHVAAGDIGELLHDPTLWADSPAGLAERVVAAVRSESVLDGPDPVVERSGEHGTRRLATWIRPVILGVVGTLFVLFGGIVVLSALSDVEQVETFTVELTSTGALPDVAGDVTVSEFDSGVRIELVAPSLPAREPGTIYAATVQRDDGTWLAAGTFRDGGTIALSAGVELDRAELFVISVIDDDGSGAVTANSLADGDVVLRAPLRR